MQTADATTPSQPLMRTNAERRKAKLERLVERYGITEVARRTEIDHRHIRSILRGDLMPTRQDGEQHPRQVGDVMARKIERAFGLPYAAMDNDLPGEHSDVALQQLTVSDVMDVADHLAVRCDDMEQQLSHGAFAELLRLAVTSMSQPPTSPMARMTYEALLTGLRAGMRVSTKK